MTPEITTIFGRQQAIEQMERIEEAIRPLSRMEFRPRETKPGSPEILIAREAAARVEVEDGYHACAENRLAGAYDDDEETRIALAVISLLRERGLVGEL